MAQGNSFRSVQSQSLVRFYDRIPHLKGDFLKKAQRLAGLSNAEKNVIFQWIHNAREDEFDIIINESSKMVAKFAENFIEDSEVFYWNFAAQTMRVSVALKARYEITQM